MNVPPYAIGSDAWPGLAKLSEELGELQQVIGKLMAYPGGDHPDGGPPLEVRLVMELADVFAAGEFVLAVNPGLPGDMVDGQREAKLKRFRGWHEQEAGL